MRIISGVFKGRRIPTTSGPGYRPATQRVREAVFSILTSRGMAWQGSRVADLFAGSGSLGLEALSRGAGHVLFVEQNRRAAALLQQTLRGLGVGKERYRVAVSDVTAMVRKAAAAPFDLTFVDPPYGTGLVRGVLTNALEHDWFAPRAMVVAEVEAAKDPQHEPVPGLEALLNRTYGQTRICLWRRSD